MQTVLALLQAFAAACGFSKKRQELNNSPEMQANAKAKSDAKVADDAAEAVAKDDLDAIRAAASE